MPETFSTSSRPKLKLYGGNHANFISSWLFLWVFGLLRVSRRLNLDPDNLLLQNSEKAQVVGDKLENFWKEESKTTKEERKPSIRRALIKTFGFSYGLLGLYKLFWAGCIFFGSYYLVNQLIVYIENHDKNKSKGDNEPVVNAYLYALGLFLSAVLSSVLINQLIAECTRIGIQVRAALMVLVYRKALNLSSVSGGNGKVVELISYHCNRVAEACVNLHFLWSSVVEIIVVIALVWVQLGVAAVPALVILVLLVPIQYQLGRLTSVLANSMASVAMARISLMSEILTAIKLIKFYAWEKYFLGRVRPVRQNEMSQLQSGLGVKVLTLFVVFGTPIIIMLACLCIQDLSYAGDAGVKASTIFTVLALLNTLRYPLIMLPIAVRTTLGSLDSFESLDEFLLRPELKPPIQEEGDIGDDPTLRILMENADFIYEGAPKPALSFLSMRVQQGEVVAIVGDVGAGKSSVLAAILGQISLSVGTRRVRGSMSYVPHDAWLLNETLRENVLFGNDLDENKYTEVLHVCALNKDLPSLSLGDETEIGERGVNLSLGQRQRVSLARAVYSDADIVLLDDPLSSMDPIVGKHIFHECILKYLKEKKKTVVFVTNQLQYLSECDRIIVMKGGNNIEQGTYEELIAKDVNLASLIGEYMEIEDPDQIDELINEIRIDPSFVGEGGDRLEEIAISGGRSGPNSRYNTIQFGNEVSTDVVNPNETTLSRIADLNTHTIHNININEMTISKIIEHRNLNVLSGAGKTRWMGNRMNREMNITAKAIERNQLTIHSLNEREGFASMLAPHLKKQIKIEVDWGVYVEYLKNSTGLTISLLIIVFFFLVQGFRIFSDWWLKKSVLVTNSSDYGYILGVYGAIVAVVVIGVYIRGFVFAWAVIRKSHHLHNKTFAKLLQAPMSYFDVTPIGRILTVFAKHQTLVDEALTDSALQFLSFLPLVLGVVIFVMVLIPWAIIPGVMLGFLCWILIHISSQVEERFKTLDATTKSPIFSHLAATLDGLASIRVYNSQSRFDEQNINKIDANHKVLFAMMQIKSWLALYVDLLGSLFVYATAIFIVVFRDSDTSHVDPSNTGLALSNALQILIFGQWAIRSGRDMVTMMSSVQHVLYYGRNIPLEQSTTTENILSPPPGWGDNGEIEFKQVTLRYNAYGVAVLKKVSFHIRPREKIGIVGKTGSGKSTLLVSLLRIVELAEGKILIDEKDISTFGLKDLRNKIAIIPQEPVLFAGTIRSNLDPLESCNDDEIWAGLRAVHLEDSVKKMAGKLDAKIIENGRDFSHGERQLLCIARALVKKTRILVLDEATSAVDSQTDNLIQETIKKNFANHTVLTIAHRLNTIMEADRILCLNEGRVVEFDTPLRLLDKTDGFFYQLTVGLGPEAAERLKQLALHNRPRSKTSMSSLNQNGSTSARVTRSQDVPSINTSTDETIQDSSPPTPSTPHRAPMPHLLEDVFHH